ncbi:MAG: sulfatase-like hydrolase/transferase [bacterium]|nr:sulfatase-like hydrolase/transferase [bacterium]
MTALGKATFDLPRDKPLFTFLHYFDAHAPYAPPPPFARMYYEGDERAPGEPVLDFLRSPANAAPNRDGGLYDWLAGVTDLRFPAREYAAGVSYTDDHVGQVVAELKRRGRYDDTLIIVVADHGEHLGEHDLWFTHTLPYQETLHVPLLVKLPQGRAAGRVIDTPVTTLDIPPTLLDWLDLPAAEGDGRSLRDLEERHDLAATRPDDVARLSVRLRALCAEQSPLGSAAASGPAELDARDRRQLHSLGYVAGSDAPKPSAPPAPGPAPGPATGPLRPARPAGE